MGGTLPVLSAFWTRPTGSPEDRLRTGQSVGSLYAVNTLGAVMGSFLTGYVLIRFLGVSRSIYSAAAVNILIGILGLVISRSVRAGSPLQKASRPKPVLRKPASPETEAAETMEAEGPGRRRAVLMAVLVGGFCSLALEVLWTRILVFVLESTAYAFACMLTCFIFGLAIGSLLASRWVIPRLTHPLFALGVVEFLQAMAVAGSILLLGKLWRIDLFVVKGLTGSALSFGAQMAVHFIDTLAILLIPTLLMGMAFPIAIEIYALRGGAIGRGVGQVYAWNTIGCVLGPIAAGFLMIPRLGLRDSLWVIIAVLFLLAVGLVLLAGKRRALWGVPLSALAVGVILVVGFVPRDEFLRTMNTYHYPSRIVYMDDGVTGTVTVHDLPDGDRLIAVDGVDVAGMNLMLRTTQTLQAYVPLLVHPNPQDVVQIGYGSGQTCGIGLDFGVARYTIVEICPGVFKAGRFFDPINRRSYAHPALRKVIMDGKNFIRLSDERFDVIMNDSTYPESTGSAALYTYEHFKACRDHLKPGGVLSCWVPLDMRPENFRMIVRSFQAAMPYASLWMANNCLNKHAVLLGTLETMHLDPPRIRQVMERSQVAADLKEIQIHSVYDFLDSLVVGPEGLKDLAGAGPLHRDDTPYVEFIAAIKSDVEGSWLDILLTIGEHHTPVSRYVTRTTASGLTEPEKALFRQYYQGTQYTIVGMVGMLEGNPEVMKQAFKMARMANPNDRDVESILKEMSDEMEALKTALQRTPDAPELRSRLAKRYMLLEQYGLAVEHYERYMELKPDNAAAWNNLGICYGNIGNIGKAAAAYQRAVRLNPAIFAAYANLAKLHERQGHPAEAIKVLETALPLLPGDEQAQIYDRLVDLHLSQGQYDVAIRYLDKAIELTAKSPQLRQELVKKREAIGQSRAKGSP